jgi:outer membrane protein assembly factor BamB
MPIYHDNVVLVCGYWHGSRALLLGKDGKSVKLLWEDQENIRGLMAQPLQKDGLVYLLDRTNGLSCFEIKTGEKYWDDSKNHTVTPSGKNPQATLVWAHDGKRQDRALILNANGELLSVTLNKESFEIHSRSQITGKTWAHPAYNKGHIFARTDKKIVCWKLNP